MIYTQRGLVRFSALLILFAALLWPLAGSGQSNTFSVANGDQDMTIFPADAGDRLGAPNSMATGDFNNDGVQDVLLGAPNAERPGTERTNNGIAYVIYGKPSLGDTEELDLKSFTNADVVVIGADPGDNLGAAVAAGDVNGDGVDDLILGAPGADGPLNQDTATGEVYVIFGSGSLPQQIDLRQNPAPVTLLGRSGNAGYGRSLVAADMNADGIRDIVVGQPQGNGPGGSRPNAGGVFVYFGAPDLVSPISDRGFKSPDLTIYGRRSGDQLGTALARGDFNNDGVPDLVIGAPLADGPANERPDAGEVFVISGGRELPDVIDLTSSTTTGTGSLRVVGGDAGDHLGQSVATGDINGDGFDDLLVGAPMASGPENRRGLAGEAYLILGRPNMPPEVDAGDNGNISTTIYGAESLDSLGSAVEIGDTDGDGLAELVLGASNAKGQGNESAGAGEVYVIKGVDPLPTLVDLGNGDFFAVIYGGASLDAFGSALALGSLDGSAQGNLLVGAVGADAPGGRTDSGLVYLFLTVVQEPPSEVTADAGPDLCVVFETEVQLDGTGSRDAEGNPLSYAWSFVSRPEGSEAALSDPADAQPSFTADAIGTYVLELTVTNEAGSTDTDRVTIYSLVKGDVNFDGTIDETDAQLVADYIVGLIDFDAQQRFAADVRPVCGTVDVNDVRWIAEFPTLGAQEPLCLDPVEKTDPTGDDGEPGEGGEEG